MDPVLVVLLFSSIAAVTAAAGVLPLVGRDRMPSTGLGWAHALAAGFMLGAAFLLMVATVGRDVLATGLGAAIGVAAVWFSHVASGTEELELDRQDDTTDDYGYKVLLVNGFHSAAEGIAIGAAAFVALPLGVFVALAMAVHNIPEATALSAVLHARGARLRQAAGLATFTNVPQVLLAVVTYAVLVPAPALLPWALGFAFGALVYLVMAEHLPESYGKAGETTIALVTILAMGIVVLLGGLPG